MTDRQRDEHRELRRRLRIEENHRHRRRRCLLEAIEEFKKVTGLNYVPFPEVLRIARELGYRGPAPSDDDQGAETREPG